MRTYVSAIVMSMVTVVSGVAAAHPGHGAYEAGGLSHSMIDHPVALAAVVVSVVGAGVWLWRRNRAR